MGWGLGGVVVRQEARKRVKHWREIRLLSAVWCPLVAEGDWLAGWDTSSQPLLLPVKVKQLEINIIFFFSEKKVKRTNSQLFNLNGPHYHISWTECSP